jgi:hypothetical protein
MIRGQSLDIQEHIDVIDNILWWLELLTILFQTEVGLIHSVIFYLLLVIL